MKIRQIALAALLLLIVPHVLYSQETAKTCFDNGVQAYRAEDFDNAILHFSKAIELDPKFVDAWFERAWSYLKLGGKPNYDKALTDVAKVLALSPDNKAICFARGEIYRSKAMLSLAAGNKREADGYLDKALADYQIALEANPTSPVIPLSIGHAHAAKGDLDSALAAYSKVLEKTPQETSPVWLRSLFENYEKQKRECDCGNFKHMWYLAGKFQYDKKHYDQAIRCFSKALDLGLTDWSVYSDRSRAYGRQGDFSRAIADASEVIKLAPYEFHYSVRAELYQKNGELDKAIADYTKAIKLERKSLKAAGGKLGTLGTFYLRRAETFKKKKDWNRAIGDYKAASKLLVPGPSKGRANILFLMALVYQEKGDSKNADKYFQQAQAMDPGLKK